MFLSSLVLWVVGWTVCVTGTIYNIETEGAVAEDDSLATCTANTGVMNATFAKLQKGDTLLIPSNKRFWVMGDIYASDLNGVTIQIDGELHYSDDRKAWPTDANGNVKECMLLEKLSDVTFTSTNPNKGLIDGHGQKWWGAIDYLLFAENRPRLLRVEKSTDILVENLYFKDSPYWTTYFHDVNNLEIRYSNISARRTNIDYHDMVDMCAFNTDGFDVAGSNVHIHDCEIWNDDDCIAVKQVSSDWGKCSENMLFERINASGVGLTIGSIGPSSSHTCVRNITFRDINMHRTFKGIYMKSRPGSGTGEITDVLYENISMDRATQWSIWIGPQQAVYKGACKISWPENPLAKCPVPPEITWKNIVLRDVTVTSPERSPGVVLGNNTNPMQDITFDNVVVTDPGNYPLGKDYYVCDGVSNGVAKDGTTPIPPCFN